MVLGELLYQAALGLLIGDKILRQIEQLLWPTDAPYRHLKPGGGRLIFAISFFPIDEVFKRRLRRSDLCLHTVRDNDGRVVSENLRNVAAVAADVLVEGVLNILAGAFGFDNKQRQPVYKAH